jgi:tetratricopeptide (TPR) repeat protein
LANRGATVARQATHALTFADAQARWDRADISGCLEALRANRSPEAAVLAARCFIRLDRPHDVLERLSTVSGAIRDSNHLLRGEYAVVSANAHFALGNADLMDTALREARMHADAAGNPALLSEQRYVEGKVAWSRHELGDARALARSAVHIAPTAKWRACAFQLLGMVAGTESKYEEQIEFYERAWTVLDESGAGEPWVRGVFLNVLCSLSKALQRLDLAQRVSDREEALVWSEDMTHMRFTVLRDIGWRHSLSDDYLRCLREASAVAPSAPWLITAFVERARLAQETGERLFARDSLEQAKSLAATCDWSQARGEEGEALLQLAALTASTDIASARKFLDVYREKVPPLGPNYLEANDGRSRAAEAYAFGVVASYGGDIALAIDRLMFAFTTWRGIGYVSRAADAALHLSRLTGADVFTGYTRRHTSPLSDTSAARETDPPSVGQRRAVSEISLRGLQLIHVEILRHMINGATKAAELSEQTGYAERTVVNKLQYIYRTLGVRRKIDAISLCLKNLLSSGRR